MSKPAELCEGSRHCRQMAEKETVAVLKRHLASHALALAQLAERIEREGALATFSSEFPWGQPHLGRCLEVEPMAVSWDQIRRWRLRAEELRTVADGFRVPSVQGMLLRLADDYERLADSAQARLTGNAPPAEEAG